MTDLWFIRHGQARFGTADYDRLSRIGHRQAKLLGKYLDGVDCRFDRVYSGSLKRQEKTARLAVPHAVPLIEPGLNEYDAQTIFKTCYRAEAARQGISLSIKEAAASARTFQRIFAPIMHQWVNAEVRVPDVPSYRDHVKGLEKTLARILADNQENRRIGIFTSGGVISMALQLSLNLAPSKALKLCWRIQNSSVTQFAGSLVPARPDTVPGAALSLRLDLLRFNALSHLAFERDEALRTFR